MSEETWMLVGSDGDASEILKSKPPLDREATEALAALLFPNEKLELVGEETLASTNPPDDQVFIGCFPGVSVIAAKEFGIDRPSKLPAIFLDPAVGRTIRLHAMHCSADWTAFAVWENGQLRRALSISLEPGILEDVGERLPFEVPYWEGEHPLLDPDPDIGDSPFPFDPIDLGDAAVLAFWGYQLDVDRDPRLLDPEDIPLLIYRRRPWWKFW